MEQASEVEIDLITGLPLNNVGAAQVDMSDDNTAPWVKKYRGTNLDSIILPAKLENIVRNAIKLGGYANYIFHSGSAGTGKTSLAEALPLMMGAEREVLYAQRDSEILETISENGMYRSGNGMPKYFVIDEGDNPSNPESFYRKLQSLIEATESNLRFIITCNDLSRIPTPITSRCTPIAFDHNGDDRDYKNRIFKHLMHIAKKETKRTDGRVEKQTVVETVEACYPDIRAMVNALHLTFLENGGNIVGHPNVIREETISDIYKLTIGMDPRKLRYYLSSNVNDFRGVYIPFGLYFLKRIPLPTSGQVDFMYIKFASMLGKAHRAAISQVNQEVTLCEFLADVMMLIAQCQMVGRMPLEPVALPFEQKDPGQQMPVTEQPGG